jgi:hypothetical protein
MPENLRSQWRAGGMNRDTEHEYGDMYHSSQYCISFKDRLHKMWPIPQSRKTFGNPFLIA